MSISLKKGTSLNLSKKEPELKKVLIGLGWEIPKTQIVDLDASAFMLSTSGKMPSEAHFVFYNNLKSPDGAIQHTGDNRTGQGDDDDEIILANLSLIADTVVEVLIIASIHEADTRKHHFGLLQNAYIRLLDVETKREILRYDLDQEFGGSTDVEFGRFRRENSEWHFVASGIPSTAGLQGYVDKYL